MLYGYLSEIRNLPHHPHVTSRLISKLDRQVIQSEMRTYFLQNITCQGLLRFSYKMFVVVCLFALIKFLKLHPYFTKSHYLPQLNTTPYSPSSLCCNAVIGAETETRSTTIPCNSSQHRCNGV